MLPIIRGLSGATAVLLTTICFAVPARAHATLGTAQAAPGSTYKGVLRVPHGCQGEATHTVSITIPEGVFAAKPMPKAGWTLAIRKGPYAKTYDNHGRPLSQGAKEFVWSKGNLPNDQYDEFVFSGQIAPDLPPGTTLTFPVIQECASVSERWVEIAAPGQDPHALRNPAPRVTLVAAGAAMGGHHMSGHHMGGSPASATASFKAGSLTVTAPWTRATPKGAPVAGGYLTVTNNGAESDRLVGGSFPGADRVEVHQMTMDNGVMHMRPIPDGLEIKPGQTVALTPGSYHLMFTGFKGQLKAGDQVKGTLTFEKAGPVEVTYQVGAMGGPAPAMGGHQHH
jgi:uncharacterized protein YcnI/copper(I)-binding protein